MLFRQKEQSNGGLPEALETTLNKSTEWKGILIVDKKNALLFRSNMTITNRENNLQNKYCPVCGFTNIERINS